MIDVTCRRCGACYRATESLAGKWVRCKKCNCRIDVPSRSTAQALDADAIPLVEPAETGQARTDPIILRVSAVKLLWPQRCACCMGQADTNIEALALQLRGGKDSGADSRTWSIPYCRLCAEHSGLANLADLDYARRSGWAVQGPICAFLFSIIFGLPLAGILERAWPLSLIGVACVGGLIAWGVVSEWADYQRLKDLANARGVQRKTCAALRSAVQYLGWHGSVHTFSFDSEDYAEAFYQANERKVVK